MKRTGRKTTIGGQFAPRLIAMLESPAYRALSLSAHRVIARLEVELGHHGGNDNGKLPVTFDHFHEYGIHRHSIAPGIREAVALGFVEITEMGRSGNGEWRRPNLFRLTYRPTAKLPATDEWRRAATLAQAEALAADARRTPRPLSPTQTLGACLRDIEVVTETGTGQVVTETGTGKSRLQ